jgi:hypothetical protein
MSLDDEMTPEQRIAQYLAKAEEAEQTAAKAIDPQRRMAWQSIAESYKTFARHMGSRG